jgi:hypothetical protein
MTKPKVTPSSDASGNFETGPFLDDAWKVTLNKTMLNRILNQIVVKIGLPQRKNKREEQNGRKIISSRKQ